MLPDAYMLTGNIQTLMEIKTKRSKDAKSGPWRSRPPPPPYRHCLPPQKLHLLSVGATTFILPQKGQTNKKNPRRNGIFTNILSAQVFHLKMYSFHPLPGVCPVTVVFFARVGSESAAMASSIQVRKETKAKRTSLETIFTLNGVPVDWS